MIRYIAALFVLTGCVSQSQFKSFNEGGAIKRWTYSVQLKDYPNDNAAQIADKFMLQYGICDIGYEIVSKTQTDDRLDVEGRCL